MFTRFLVKFSALLLFGFIFISFPSAQSPNLSVTFIRNWYWIFFYKFYNHLQKSNFFIRCSSKYRLHKLGTKVSPERSLKVHLTSLFLPLNKAPYSNSLRTIYQKLPNPYDHPWIQAVSCDIFKWHDFLGKKRLLNLKCVFLFSLQLSSDTFSF